MDELKQTYNMLLQRYNKAEKYFARNDVPVGEKQKHAKACQELVNEMADIVEKLKMSDEQILNGFEEVST